MSTGRRLFDFDPVSGLETWYSFDPVTKESILEYKHRDLEPALDLNQAMANDTDYTRRGIKRDWWHYAFIPDVICIKMMSEHGINIWDSDHLEAVFRLVNSREYRKLKTTELMHMMKKE